MSSARVRDASLKEFDYRSRGRSPDGAKVDTVDLRSRRDPSVDIARALQQLGDQVPAALAALRDRAPVAYRQALATLSLGPLGTARLDEQLGLLACAPDHDIAAELRRRRAPSEALHPVLRQRAETSLGVGLGHVEVYRGAQAQRAARGLGAAAFAHGHSIVLGSGIQNAPNPIMAEEVAHVVQQRQAAPASGISSPSDRAEVSARGARSDILAGRRTQVGAVSRRGVMRVERDSVSEEDRNARDLSPQFGSMESRSDDELRAIVDDDKGKPRYAKRGYLYEPNQPGAVTLELWLAAFDETQKRTRGPRATKEAETGQAHLAQGQTYAPDNATPVQRKGRGSPSGVDVRGVARAGFSGGGAPLPYLAQLQRSFGRHDLAGVRAHVGGSAVVASQRLHARAYAMGERVAFAAAPDLHTAAHEAAHVIQQRRGVHIPGGLSAENDPFEHHANQVADAVIAGRPAEWLLNRAPAGTSRWAVQREQEGEDAEVEEGVTLPDGVGFEVRGTRGNPTVVLRKQWLLDKGVAPTATQVTSESVIRPLVEGINSHFKLGFSTASLDYAIPKVGLAISPALGKRPDVFSAFVGKSLFEATGLPPGTEIAVVVRRSSARKKGDSDSVRADVLIQEQLLVDAGLAPGVELIKSTVLNSKIIDRLEKAFGLKAIEASSTSVRDGSFKTSAFQSDHPPGTWILNISWNDLKWLFGDAAMAEYVGEEREDGGSLSEGGLLKGPGVTDKDAEWVLAFLQQHFGGGAGESGLSEIDRFLVESLRKLDKHPDRDAIIAELTGGGSTSRGLSAVGIDNAIHAHDLASRRKDAGLEEIEPPEPGEGREPIVNTPVQGQMVSFSEPLVPEKEAQFWFQTKRLADAYRSSMVHTEWRAWDDKGKLVDEETTNHHEDDTSDTFDVEFDKAGKYKVYAYVRHSYYLPNDFTKTWEVKTEEAVTKEQEDAEFVDLGGRPGDTRTHWYDAGLDNAVLAPSYAKGAKGEGEVADDFYDDYDEQAEVKLVKSSIANIDELIARYKDSRDPTERAIAERAEKTREQIKELTDELDDKTKDPHNVFFKVRGQYTSRTAGLRSGPLSLIAAYNTESKKVVLKDYTLIVDGEVIEGTGNEGDFAGSLEEAFVDLCKSYPDGLMSIVAEKLDDHGVGDGKTLYFKLKTDSFWKDFKGTVFDPAVDIVVNITGAILLAFPPTSAAGAAIIIGYNSVKTAAQLADWADKGTLTGGKVGLALGQLLVDVLPVVGRAKVITTLGGRSAFLLKAGEIGGQALIITEQAKAAIERMRDGIVRELAELEKEIRTIQATRPWDPRLETLKARRTKMIEKFRTAATDVWSDLAARGLIIVAGSAFAATLANKALRKTYLKLVDEGVVTRVAGEGPPVRYNPESGKLEVNPAKEADISEAALDAALEARTRDLALAKTVPDLATRQKLREVLGTDDIEVRTGATESRVDDAGDGKIVHVKEGDTVLDALATAEVQARTAPRIKELSESGAFKHEPGKDARYDPETGQIVGDRTRITPEKLAELDQLYRADMAAWQQKFAEALGVEKVEIQRGGSGAAARFDGAAATVRIPKGKSIKAAFDELAAAAKARKPAPAGTGTDPPPGKVQPDPVRSDPAGADTGKVPDVPRGPEGPKPTYTGTKDVGVVTSRNNVIVGDKAPDAGTGHATLQKLAGGDQSALGAVGVGKLPDSFPANQTEWGLGRTPEGDIIVIKGEPLGVDWGVKDLEGVTALAHSHPFLPSNKLKAPDGGPAGRGFTLDELAANPGGHHANTVHLVPSGRDVVFCAQNGLPSHSVHTPFRHEGGGRVRNPTGAGDSAPTVSFAIEGARLVGTHKDLDNLTLYAAEMKATAGGKEIWSGEIYATRWELDGGRKALEEAALKRPADFVDGPAPKGADAKTDAGTGPEGPAPAKVDGPDVKPRHDVRDIPESITARSGVKVDVPLEGNTGLEHILRGHTVEHFDPVARAAEPKYDSYPPTHETTLFKPGTATNARELYTLIRQALEGKAGRKVKAGQNNKLELTIRGQKVEVWVGPKAGGGMQVNSIYPVGKFKLTKAEILAMAQDIIHGRKTLQQVRNEVAAKAQ